MAALLVIGVHAAFTSGFTGRSGLGRYASRLEIGVEVFFVISGFLLYRPFAMEHFGGRRALRPMAFWGRRLRRIVPAYWAAFIIVSYVLHTDQVRHTWTAPIVYLGFAQIYFPHYVLSGITQAWSLCTEMSFYLALPLWAWLLGRRRRGAGEQLRLELLGLLALTAVSFAYRGVVLTHHSALAVTMPNWLPGYLDMFALGMLLAVVSAWSEMTGERPSWLWHPALPWFCWGAALAAFVAVSNVGLPVTPVTPSPLGLSLVRQELYGMFGFFMVVPAVFGPQTTGLIRRFLAWKPLALIGVVSYGVYLWHETWIRMIFVWTGDHLFGVPFPLMLLSVTALAVGSATASYLVIERPFLRLGRPTPLRRPGVTPEAAARPGYGAAAVAQSGPPLSAARAS